MVEYKEKSIIILIIVFILGMLLLPFWGLEHLNISGIFSRVPNINNEIFWKIRVPRVLLAMLAGASLSVCGLVFQAIFRNPLATPFTLGTATAASLGASIYIALGFSFTLLGVSGLTLFAFLGALIAIGIIVILAYWQTNFNSELLLLSGVALSIFFSSIIIFLQYISQQAYSMRILHWLMGSLQIVNFKNILEILPLFLISLGVVYWFRFDLNLLTTGYDLAASRGMPVIKVRALLLLSAGIMLGTVVAVTGPISFVGLIVPNICRLWLGPDHRKLVIAAPLLGGIFLAICDVLSRIILSPAELPVGIVTAMLGGPFFLWLLCHKR